MYPDQIDPEQPEIEYSYFYYEANSLLGYFADYLDVIEEFLENETAKWDKIFSEDPHQRLVGYKFASLHNFPYLLRESLFIEMLGFVEKELNDICKYLQAKKQLNLALGDIEGRGIARARKYLTKVAQLNISDTEWMILIDYQTLRNCLVHGSGEISDCDKQEFLRNSYIPKQSNLAISQERIILKKGFCEEVILKVRAFFNELENDL